jgi:hypothetical protein
MSPSFRSPLRRQLISSGTNRQAESSLQQYHQTSVLVMPGEHAGVRRLPADSGKDQNQGALLGTPR